MKITEIKEMTVEELNAKLVELKKELFVCSNTLTYKLLHFLL